MLSYWIFLLTFSIIKVEKRLKIRKTCCRKKTARCRSSLFCLKFDIRDKFKSNHEKPAFRAPNISVHKKAVLSQRWPRDARYINRSWAVAEIWPFVIIEDGGRHLEFVRIENSAIRSALPKTPPYNQTWSGSDDRLRRYGHLKVFQDGGGHHLGFVRIVNSAVRSAVPENPTLEPNMEWIGRPVAEIWPF